VKQAIPLCVVSSFGKLLDGKHCGSRNQEHNANVDCNVGNRCG
jgi:hypothetical protein